MPRYFFHIIDGNEYPDTEGTVLANPDAARAEAIVVSGEMLKDLGGAFWNNGEWQVRVEDEAGNKVCALTFRLTGGPSTRWHCRGVHNFLQYEKPRQPGELTARDLCALLQTPGCWGRV